MSAGTILIVDQSDLVAKYLSTAVRHYGYSVTVARSGSEALVLALKCEFQAVLLASDLPDWKGADFIKLLKTLKKTKNLPLILLVSEGHEALLSLEQMLNGIRCIRKTQLGPERLSEALEALTTSPVSTGPGRRAVFIVAEGKPAQQVLPQQVAAFNCDVLLITELSDTITSAPSISPDLVIVHFRPQDLRSSQLIDGITSNKYLNDTPFLFLADKEELGEISRRFANRTRSAFLAFPTPPTLLQNQITQLCELKDQSQAVLYLETVLSAVSTELDLSRSLLSKTEQASTVSQRFRHNLLPTMGYALRDPVVEIGAFAENLLGASSLDSSTREALTAISNDAQKLIRLTQGLFQLVEIERSTLVAAKRRCTVLEIVWKLNDEFRSLLEQSPARLCVEVSDALPQQVVTDPDLLFQAAAQAIYSALKRSAQTKIEVMIFFQHEKSRICISVSDYAPRLNRIELGKLFELPWNSEEFGSQGGSGVDAELPFMRYLLQKLEGSLKVLPHPEGGNTFQLSFPVSEVLDGAHSDQALLATDNSPGLQKPDLGGVSKIEGRVLILEKDIQQRTLYSHYCKGTKISAQFVSDADELVECLREKNFDLLILNLDIHELNIAELQARLSEIRFANPVLGVAHRIERSSRLITSNALCNAICYKPLSVGKLLQLIKFYCEQDYLEKIKEARATRSNGLSSIIEALPEQIVSEGTSDAPELGPMVAEYIESLPMQLGQIEAASNDGDWKTVGRITRQIAGDAGLFGFPILSQIARLLMQLSAKNPTLALITEHLGVLKLVLSKMQSGGATVSIARVELPKVAIIDEIVEVPSVSIDQLSKEQQAAAKEYLAGFESEFGRVQNAYQGSDWRKVAFISNELAGAAAMSGLKPICTSLLQIEQACYAKDEKLVKREVAYVVLLAEQFGKLLGTPRKIESQQAQPSKGASADLGETQIIVSEIIADDPALIPLIKEFLGEVSEQVLKIEAAFKAKSWTDLQNLAHEIAGAAGMYGYPECRNIAKELQKSAQIQAETQVPAILTNLKRVASAMLQGGERI